VNEHAVGTSTAADGNRIDFNDAFGQNRFDKTMYPLI